MNIRRSEEKDYDDLVQLIGKFRIELASFRGVEKEIDLDAAEEELDGYRSKDYPIYVAEKNSKLVGYIVCRVEQDVVWAESLYVLPDFREQGIGSSLYEKAEEIADDLGSDTVYNWVHPNNHKMIEFLKKKGYDVLNLIELRKKREGESTDARVRVGEHEFDY